MKSNPNEAQRLRRQEMPDNIHYPLYKYFILSHDIPDSTWLFFDNNQILEYFKDKDIDTVRGIGKKTKERVYQYLNSSLPPEPRIKRKRFYLFGWKINVVMTKLK